MSDTQQDDLEEIRRIIPERTRLAEQLAALDKRIAELAGFGAEEQRKPAKKTFSPKEFARGCGI